MLLSNLQLSIEILPLMEVGVWQMYYLAGKPRLFRLLIHWIESGGVENPLQTLIELPSALDLGVYR